MAKYLIVRRCTLLTCLLISLLYFLLKIQAAFSAPTPHLAISVLGDTPTLVVSVDDATRASEGSDEARAAMTTEIGSVPEILRTTVTPKSATISTTTVIAAEPTNIDTSSSSATSTDAAAESIFSESKYFSQKLKNKSNKMAVKDAYVGYAKKRTQQETQQQQKQQTQQQSYTLDENANEEKRAKEMEEERTEGIIKDTKDATKDKVTNKDGTEASVAEENKDEIGVQAQSETKKDIAAKAVKEAKKAWKLKEIQEEKETREAKKVWREKVEMEGKDAEKVKETYKLKEAIENKDSWQVKAVSETKAQKITDTELNKDQWQHQAETTQAAVEAKETEKPWQVTTTADMNSEIFSTTSQYIIRPLTKTTTTTIAADEIPTTSAYPATTETLAENKSSLDGFYGPYINSKRATETTTTLFPPRQIFKKPATATVTTTTVAATTTPIAATDTPFQADNEQSTTSIVNLAEHLPQLQQQQENQQQPNHAEMLETSKTLAPQISSKQNFNSNIQSNNQKTEIAAEITNEGAAAIKAIKPMAVARLEGSTTATEATAAATTATMKTETSTSTATTLIRKISTPLTVAENSDVHEGDDDDTTTNTAILDKIVNTLTTKIPTKMTTPTITATAKLTLHKAANANSQPITIEATTATVMFPTTAAAAAATTSSTTDYTRKTAEESLTTENIKNSFTEITTLVNDAEQDKKILKLENEKQEQHKQNNSESHNDRDDDSNNNKPNNVSERFIKLIDLEKHDSQSKDVHQQEEQEQQDQPMQDEDSHLRHDIFAEQQQNKQQRLEEKEKQHQLLKSIEKSEKHAQQQNERPLIERASRLSQNVYSNLKNQHEIEQTNMSVSYPHVDIKTDGHDGIKQTKKKQLNIKHFFVEAHEVSKATKITEAATTNSNDKPRLATAAPATMSSLLPMQKINKSLDLTATQTSATLAPVHNGYLGPIIMEERTFSVIHPTNQRPKSQVEASIESQLRDGRIVEIIAPPPQAPSQNNQIEAQSLDVSSFSSTTTAVAETTTAKTMLPPIIQRTPAQFEEVQRSPVLSTTVFQVSEPLTSTTRLPANKKYRPGTLGITMPQYGRTSLVATNSERTESKISDIQVEVYDSTVDSIVASTNFRDSPNPNVGYYQLSQEKDVSFYTNSEKPPFSGEAQERFTQYVIDRTDSSTPESNIGATAGESTMHGKPQPAAIEIHINVSEGLGSGSEDLEFSYRESDFSGAPKFDKFVESNSYPVKIAQPTQYNKPFRSSSTTRNYSSTNSGDRSDEILVVEIIDTGENNTENAGSAEKPLRAAPVADTVSDVEMHDSPRAIVKPPQDADEIFLADVKKSDSDYLQPPPPPPPPPRKPSIDRDSDTIFYISNTEVKVGESLPTANTNYELQQSQLRKTKLENQFFPYLATTNPNHAKSESTLQQKQQQPAQQHRYEEDIILSPLRDTSDSLKIFRSSGTQNDDAPPLDVTYIGESIIEVEQSSGAGLTSTAGIPVVASTPMPDVIIQPAVLPAELSIGVPVIGELPPQIELKEIDFMPDEANQQRSGVYENDIEENEQEREQERDRDREREQENIVDVDVDRLVESSIQYGGDLIDESAGGGGFDGVEGSYPFGNLATMNRKIKHGIMASSRSSSGSGSGSGSGSRANSNSNYAYAHFTVNHGVNNLRKDELSVDVANAVEIVDAENSTMKELLLLNGNNKNANDTGSLNVSYTVAERISNATAFSVMEERTDVEIGFKNLYTLIIGLFIVLLPIVVTVSLACALRMIYNKYQANSRSDNNSDAALQQETGSGNGGLTEEEREKSIIQLIPSQLSTNIKTAQSELNFTDTLHHPNCRATNQNHMPSSINLSTFTNITAAFNIPKQEQDSANAAFINSSFLKPSTATATKTIPTIPLYTTTTTASFSSEVPNSVRGHLSNISTGPSGSVTKMTLKNNHLIVETEERNDISRNARETKMHYTSDKDGIFVVEVSRGIDSKSIPESPVGDGAEQKLPILEAKQQQQHQGVESKDNVLLPSHEEVQIHPPPSHLTVSNTTEDLQRSLHQIEELDETSTFSPNPSAERKEITNEEAEQQLLMRNCNTGLSQSDLSSTSSMDSNRRYTYGNQELYTREHAGYGASMPTVNSSPETKRNMGSSAQQHHQQQQQHDRKSENGHSPYKQSHSNCSINGNESFSQLSSDNIAHEMSTTTGDKDDMVECNEQNQVKHDCVDEVGFVKQTSRDDVSIATTTTTTETTEYEVTTNSNSNTAKATIKVNDPMPGQTSLTELETKSVNDSVASQQSHSNGHNGISMAEESMEEDEEQQDTENNAYDSIMSLPDPPSTEEIKQFNDFSLIDTNQLDSLPPPPPPLVESDEKNTAAEYVTAAVPATTIQTKSIPERVETSPPASPTLPTTPILPKLTNGDIEKSAHEPVTHTTNNKNNTHINSILPPHLSVTSNGKMSPETLTPPASPLPSPPPHFSNGSVISNGGICAPPLPMAVDVNGS